jgi:hypothetical protein
MQFGCARHDQSVRAALAAYKGRFVRSLPAVQQGHVDFGRPVFLAAAFYMVARKNKVAVSWRLLWRRWCGCLLPRALPICGCSTVYPHLPPTLCHTAPWLSHEPPTGPAG